MTFEEAFNSGYKFMYNPSSTLDVWWKKLDENHIEIIFLDDYESNYIYTLKKAYGLYKSEIKQAIWELHPDDEKLYKFNNKLETLIND